MTWTVAAVLAWSLALPSAPQQEAPVEPKAAAALTAMASGDFAAVEGQFTDRMQEAWPAGKLSTAWAGLSEQLGRYAGCGTHIRVVRISDRRMVITPCLFGSAAVDIQFAFDLAGRIAGMVFRPGAAGAYAPPRYADLTAFAEEAVTVGSGEWALPGTLSLPAGTARVPGIVLVHGSGQQDRDTTFGPNRPFKDLALGLASRGIAVLRYDKRNKAHGARLAGRAGLTVRDEVIDDAVQAVNLLRAHPRIDPARVFVLGKSLGGMLIPRIATAAPRAAGWIVMAGAARPIEDAIVAQATHMASADGTVTPEEQKGIDDMAAVAARIRSLTREDALKTELILGAPASYWLDLRNYDPPAAARTIKGRMLVLQGDRDYQVTTAEFERWKKALAHRSDVTFRNYPSLNHLFMAGTGRSLPAEYLAPGHVDEQVVRDIAAWILGRPPRDAR